MTWRTSEDHEQGQLGSMEPVRRRSTARAAPTLGQSAHISLAVIALHKSPALPCRPCRPQLNCVRPAADAADAFSAALCEAHGPYGPPGRLAPALPRLPGAGRPVRQLPPPPPPPLSLRRQLCLQAAQLCTFPAAGSPASAWSASAFTPSPPSRSCCGVSRCIAARGRWPQPCPGWRGMHRTLSSLS